MYVDLYPRLWSTSEDEHHVISVIRRRVMVTSSMFTQRAEAGALKLGGPEQTECGSKPEQKLRSRARAGSAEARLETRRCVIVFL